jgi:hypothetical protein
MTEFLDKTQPKRKSKYWTAQYKLGPNQIEFGKLSGGNFRLNFSIDTYNSCHSSNGIYLYLRITVYYSFIIWLQPIGEWKINKR